MKQPILTMTATAKDYYRRILDAHSNSAKLHISVKKSGCSGLKYETQVVNNIAPTDLLCDCEGFQVWIDKESIPFIQGSEIVLEKLGPKQSQIKFYNPNADNLCGCGESFNLKKDFQESAHE
jgi:iron-sulfur cluster assembly protein